jgi:hypothetical protein
VGAAKILWEEGAANKNTGKYQAFIFNTLLYLKQETIFLNTL